MKGAKVEIVYMDIRNYAKYLLREGTDVEKRELMGCFQSKIEVKNKEVSFIKKS